MWQQESPPHIKIKPPEPLRYILNSNGSGNGNDYDDNDNGDNDDDDDDDENDELRWFSFTR